MERPMNQEIDSGQNNKQRQETGSDHGLGLESAAGNGVDGKESAGNSKFAEDIYLWEHGVAVEPWPEPVDLAALLDSIENLVTRFVTLPKWATEGLALWVVHTFAFHLRFVTTYIGLESPEKRCGKTTLLTVLSELVQGHLGRKDLSPVFPGFQPGPSLGLLRV